MKPVETCSRHSAAVLSPRSSGCCPWAPLVCGSNGGSLLKPVDVPRTALMTGRILGRPGDCLQAPAPRKPSFRVACQVPVSSQLAISAEGPARRRSSEEAERPESAQVDTSIFSSRHKCEIVFEAQSKKERKMFPQSYTAPPEVELATNPRRKTWSSPFQQGFDTHGVHNFLYRGEDPELEAMDEDTPVPLTAISRAHSHDSLEPLLEKQHEVRTRSSRDSNSVTRSSYSSLLGMPPASCYSEEDDETPEAKLEGKR
ncbi:hypothetical protein CYMTET_16301 [Cymbomonas tetramitiformis]|uniref:Uncharacterized protein n=1 Tax=Cymbomonas tetramitiformis TaxID=36881 RepID=A0AAE0GCM5_9CHLO|nr:hypothetical protein CYMTET_16301 [Cymbomonas tetramitiformis]